MDFRRGPGFSPEKILDALGFSTVKIDTLVAEQTFFYQLFMVWKAIIF